MFPSPAPTSSFSRQGRPRPARPKVASGGLKGYTGSTFIEKRCGTREIALRGWEPRWSAALSQSEQESTNGPKFGIGIEVPKDSATKFNKLNVDDDTGHTFAYFKDDKGNIVSIFSFGPGDQIGASNKSQFKNGQLPGDPHWTLNGNANTWEFTITPQQMANGLKAVSDLKANPPNYTPKYQCTSSALAVGAATGVKLPDGVGRVVVRMYGIVLWTGRVSNPYHLNQQMTQQFGSPRVVSTSIFPEP
jgi:hypothetical protein